MASLLELNFNLTKNMPNNHKKILELLTKAKDCLSTSPIQWEEYYQLLHQTLQLIEEEPLSKESK